MTEGAGASEGGQGSTKGGGGVGTRPQYLKRGGGVWDPQLCLPKMARQDFPSCTVTLVWRGGGGSKGGNPPLAVYGHSEGCSSVLT